MISIHHLIMHVLVHCSVWRALFTVLLISVTVSGRPSYSYNENLYRTSLQNVRSCQLPNLSPTDQHSCRFFTIAIDAGSTGTRLHLYEMKKRNPFDPSDPVKFEKEFFEQLRPGVSSFATDPNSATDQISELLSRAQRILPEHFWAFTPVSVRATAGLRLLPADQADDILQAIWKAVRASRFLVRNDSVGLLSGTDEGILAWLGANALLGRFYSYSNSATAAILDLGGGSTQATLQPFDQTNNFPTDHTVEIDVFGTIVQLYTRSYLGNGLEASRLSIIKANEDSTDTMLINECMSNGFTLPGGLTDADTIWNVQGSNNYNFDNCLYSVVNYVERSGIEPIADLRNMQILAISAFFFTAKDAGIVTNEDGCTTTVDVWKQLAAFVCSRATSVEFPWQCTDYTYIYALLHYGYGIPEQNTIYLVRRINQFDVSWTLGISLQLLNGNSYTVSSHR